MTQLGPVNPGVMYEDKDGTWKTALYMDDGRAITTHSMLKTFRRCPKQAQYKYVYRLKRRLMGQPLKRGTWVHELLELLHQGEDWRAHHKKLSLKFDEMFDEEKDHYGNLPVEILALMEAYEWHYALDPWKVHDTEFTLETEWPDGSIYRGKVDMLIENQFGLWLVDHKSHRSLPDFTFRLLDAQSALYLWAAIRNKIPVQGFIWNYIRWKAPTIPALVDRNRRLTRRSFETDYTTFTRTLRKYREEHPDTFKVTKEYVQMQQALKAQRYMPGAPQTSPFFYRSILEKDKEMLKQVARENFHTATRMNAYPFDRNEIVERTVRDGGGCRFDCSYTDICSVELLGGNIKPLIRQNYTIGDPMDYYQDRAGDDPERS